MILCDVPIVFQKIQYLFNIFAHTVKPEMFQNLHEDTWETSLMLY